LGFKSAKVQADDEGLFFVDFDSAVAYLKDAAEVYVVDDRDTIAVGDLVYAVFFNGAFTRHFGKVEESSEGLFIYTETVKDDEQGRIRLTGFLKNADEVRKAVIDKGHLCFAHQFPERRDMRAGLFLVCVPINAANDTISWNAHPPEDCLPEPERLEAKDAEKLRCIAKELGCDLY